MSLLNWKGYFDRRPVVLLDLYTDLRHADEVHSSPRILQFTPTEHPVIRAHVMFLRWMLLDHYHKHAAQLNKKRHLG